jgi:hypothetical protein
MSAREPDPKRNAPASVSARSDLPGEAETSAAEDVAIEGTQIPEHLSGAVLLANVAPRNRALPVCIDFFSLRANFWSARGSSGRTPQA